MTDFQDGTLITMEAMGCQVHVIRKAIRPIFADPVSTKTSWSSAQSYTYIAKTIVISLLCISFYDIAVGIYQF